MRLLEDENFPRDAVASLREAGHDVLWIHEYSPGISDEKVLVLASAERRLLLTFDKDFGELAFRCGLPSESGIILFRVSPQSPHYITRVASAIFLERSDWAGHFSVIEPDAIRMRRLPNSSPNEET